MTATKGRPTMSTTLQKTPHDIEQEYQRISRAVMDAGGLHWRQKLMLMTLIDPRVPRVVMGLESVASRTGMSPALCERIANDLEDLGVLEVWRAVEGRQRRPRPVAYRIRLDRLDGIRRHQR